MLEVGEGHRLGNLQIWGAMFQSRFAFYHFSLFPSPSAFPCCFFSHREEMSSNRVAVAQAKPSLLPLLIVCWLDCDNLPRLGQYSTGINTPQRFAVKVIRLM